MTDKNEVLELAKKHGAQVRYACGNTDHCPDDEQCEGNAKKCLVPYDVTMKSSQLLAFAAALEEKHQAQIAMLERALTRLMASDRGIAAASDDDLRAAVADINADGIVREQADSVLQAREAISATKQELAELTSESLISMRTNFEAQFKIIRREFFINHEEIDVLRRFASGGRIDEYINGEIQTAWVMYKAATQQSTEAFLAEVLAKALGEAALIAARVKCPEEWTKESKHAWDMATAAAYRELRRVAAELRNSAAQPEGKESYNG